MAPLSTSSLLALAAAAISFRRVLAAPAPEPKVLVLDFEKKSTPISDTSYVPGLNRAKRTELSTGSEDDAGSSALYALDTASGLIYLINVTIGTPGQSFQLQFDTGSSDTWVPRADSAICKASPQLCSTGWFNYTKSDTFVNTTNTDLTPNYFWVDYIDGTNVKGDYMADTLNLGGMTIPNMTMGLAKEITNAPGGDAANFTGLLGAGYDMSETLYLHSNKTYPGILTQLVNQGTIHTRAFSLYLNELTSVSGSILFGGVDSSKYTGDLVAVPNKGINTYSVAIAGMSVSDYEGNSVYSSSSGTPIVLDSGSAISSVPKGMALEIAVGLGVIYHSLGLYLIPCDAGSTQGVIDFQFGSSSGPIVKVPIAEFIQPLHGFNVTFENGKQACRWGLEPAENLASILGDNFLRSAYVVYNVDGNQLAIAQANFDDKDSSVTEITAASSIPGVTSTASARITLDRREPTVTPTTVTESDKFPVATGAFALGSPTSSSTSSATSSGTASTTSSGTSSPTSSGTASTTSSGTASTTSSGTYPTTSVRPCRRHHSKLPAL